MRMCAGVSSDVIRSAALPDWACVQVPWGRSRQCLKHCARRGTCFASQWTRLTRCLIMKYGE